MVLDSEYPCNGAHPSAAWRARAEELAAWAWARCVNRTDAWGGYWNIERREQLGKTTTRPAKNKRGRVYLTPATIERHFRAACPEDVVGLHTTSPDNTSLWGGIELDCHGEGGNTPEANTAAALGWYSELAILNLRPLLNDSDGKGGYHLRTLFSKPVPTDTVYAFLRWLVSDYADYGLTAPPETFPKQAGINPDPGPGHYGNWLRLPGRHHTREHWATMWDGTRWLAGDEAVAFMLSLAGDDPALIPVVQPAPTRGSELSRRRTIKSDNYGSGRLARRIAAYAAKLPHRGEGQGRDDVAYSFAAWLVRDLGLSDHVALAWLQRWDDGNTPPKGAARLKEILASAHRYGTHAYQSGLPVVDPSPHIHHHVQFEIGDR